MTYTTDQNTARRLLGRAIADASVAHEGQYTKDGLPYILHPLHVMDQFTDSVEKIVAVLHDVVEDCDEWTVARVLENYGPLIAAAVDALSRRKEQNESYDDMLVRCRAHPLATRVKLADLHHNSDMFRLPKLSDKDLCRVNKYHRARVYLQSIGAERPDTERGV